MAKKTTGRATIWSAQHIDSGYFYGSHTLNEMIELLEQYVESYGPDAELCISVDQYDDYNSELDVCIRHGRLETDAEYDARIAKEMANKERSKKLKERAEQRKQEKQAALEKAERAEMERLMKKYVK
jgi:hypothetical protein